MFLITACRPRRYWQATRVCRMCGKCGIAGTMTACQKVVHTAGALFKRWLRWQMRGRLQTGEALPG